MRSVKNLVFALLLATCLPAGNVLADTVNLFVDSAPNVYGSPDYPAWRDNAYAAAANGTFVNMANSHDPANAGTTNFEMEDAMVYSFGDLGRRLHFVYWIEGVTVEQITGQFQIAMYYEWDGVTYDFYNEYYGSTWLSPSSWINYDADGDGDTDGVIGTAGFAWWGAYGVNTPEALAQDLAEWDLYQGDITFMVRLNGVEYSLVAHHAAPVPEPGTLFLLGSGLIGIGVYVKRGLETSSRGPLVS